MKKTIYKAGFAVFQNKKILLARYQGNTAFYIIGGVVQNGETEETCLVRKVPDEIGAYVKIDSLRLLAEFKGLADGRSDTNLHIKLYTGNLEGEVIPSHDVEELRYFDTNDDLGITSDIAIKKIFPWLKEHKYIL